MVRITHRPDPPPEVDNNRYVHKAENVLNKEASARLFEQALVKASGEKQAVEQSKASVLGRQSEVESKADSVLGARARESVLAIQSELTTQDVNSATQVSASERATEGAVEECAELDTSEITEAEQTDDVGADDDDLAANMSATPSGVELNATQQMFENIRDANSSADFSANTAQSGETSGINNQEPSANVVAQGPVAHSGMTAESRVSSMSSLSDLVDMLETTSQLPVGNEWTLILEDDGPISELLLSSNSDGQWNIGMVTSFDSGAVDSHMIDNLRSQLSTAGVAVADIELLDKAPTNSSVTIQADAQDRRTNNIG